MLAFRGVRRPLLRLLSVCAAAALCFLEIGGAARGMRLLPSRRTGAGDPIVATALPDLDPALDGWDGEVFAAAAQQRLDVLAAVMAGDHAAWGAALADLGGDDFAGGALRPERLTEIFREGPLAVSRARATASDRSAPFRGRDGLARALVGLAGPLAPGAGLRAEFQIVRVEMGEGTASATILYAGYGPTTAGTVEQTATWTTRWSRPGGQAAPRLIEARAVEYEEIARQGKGPLFAEATEAVLGANRSYREQLLTSVDHWLERTESWIESDGFGHNGMAVGDVNGDGLDDIYFCQMGGLPNLLYVQNPDGTATDRSVEAGVDWLERTRSALFVDFDNDGDQDLVAATSVALLFMGNDGTGKFEPRASLSVTGGTVSDRPLGGTRAGGGTEGGTEGGHSSRGGDLGGSSTSDLISLAAADYDNDGLVDLYAAAYHASSEEASQFALPAPYHDANNGGNNILLRNKGNWEFEDTTRSSGMDVNNRRFSFAAAWEDYDNDGDQDLYVANDFGRKNLYRNDGGHFTDVAQQAGAEDVAAGMSADWSDYDEDGLMDVYTGNMFSAAGSRVAAQREFRMGMDPAHLPMYRRHARGNSLFRNVGKGRFEDVSEAAGVTMGRWAWGSKWIDLNNDGRDDVLVANGYFTKDNTFDLSSFFWRKVIMQSPDHPVGPGEAEAYQAAWKTLGRLIRHQYSFAGQERNCAFLNTGTDRFATVSATTGLDWPDDARAIAVTDWDSDGDLDAWIINRNGPRARLGLNGGAGGASVSFVLQGSGRSNRDAIGARLELIMKDATGARTLHRGLRAGEAYLAQSSKWVHFGLGGRQPRIERLDIRWPDGALESFRGMEPGGRYRVLQGSGRVEPLPSRARVTLAAGTVASAPVQDDARVILSAPAPAPLVEYTDLKGEPVFLQGDRSMSLVLLVGDDCPACEDQIAAFAGAAKDLRGAGLRVVALQVGAGGSVLRRAVEAGRWPFEAGNAADDLPDKLDVLQRKVLWIPRLIPLPTSFLVDGDGLCPALYKGPIDARRVLADIPELRGGGERKVSLALPFSGRRQTRGGPNLFDYMDGVAEAYLDAGYPAEAESYYRKVLRIQPRRESAHANLGIALAKQDKVDEAIAEYRAALAIDPNQPGTLANLGMALAQQGKGDEAVEAYRKALEMEPNNVPALVSLAGAMASQGDYGQAVELYGRALAENPGNALAHNNIALALSRLGRDDEAIRHYREVLRIEPSTVVVRINLALALARRGRKEESLAQLEEAVRLKPDHPEALYHLGVTLLRQGRRDEARERLEEALRLKPGYGQASYYLSVALVQEGRTDEALGRFAEAARLQPDSPEAAVRLAWILATHPDPLFRDGAQALALARRACPGSSSSMGAACLDTLAAAQAEAGHYAQAVETATRAVEAASASADAERLAGIRSRLQLYQAGKPFRDTASRGPSGP